MQKIEAYIVIFEANLVKQCNIPFEIPFVGETSLIRVGWFSHTSSGRITLVFVAESTKELCT